jgi:hypothetical protein
MPQTFSIMRRLRRTHVECRKQQAGESWFLTFNDVPWKLPTDF